jgi:HAUS augmin-like complex subunit 1
MDNLTPSDLFSPSKARQQRAQAQDWAYIDTWLQYKYSGRTIPTFERNDETLKVLRELSVATERADENKAIQQRLEREALKELDEVWTCERSLEERMELVTRSLKAELY